MNLLKVCAHSSFLLIILFCCLLEIGTHLYALNDKTVTDFDRAPHKCRNLSTAFSNSEIILTGSSLFLYPAIRLDEEMEKIPPRYDSDFMTLKVGMYSQSRFLESAIATSLHRPVALTNLATGGALMSDQYLVLKHWLANGKKPEYVICDISPREFQDNWQKKIDQTTICAVLKDKFSLLQLLRADFESGSFTSLDQLNSLFYDNRKVNQAAIVTAVHKLLNRNSGLSGSPTLASPLPEPIEVVPDYKNDYMARNTQLLEYYKKTYVPLDMVLYNKEMFFLKEYLNLARSAKIKVLLILMPLPKENLEMLPLAFREHFKADIKANALKYGANVLEPTEHQVYTSEHYEDLAHLNAKGGRLLFSAIAECFRPDQRPIYTH